jgi:hypothetical protein
VPSVPLLLTHDCQVSVPVSVLRARTSMEFDEEAVT